MIEWTQPVVVVVSDASPIAGAPPNSPPYVHGVYLSSVQALDAYERILADLPPRLRMDLHTRPGTITFHTQGSGT